MEKKNRGLTRIIKAFGYSRDGLRAAWLTEASFRQETLLCAVLTLIACLVDVTGVERSIMLASLLLLLIVELINTAVETVIERISPEIHPLSKKAKDVGSAAVLLAFLLASGVWIGILA